MASKLALLALLSVFGSGAAAGASTAIYKSFEVSNHGATNQKYRFSGAAATLKDPIVITAVERKLTKSDRANRVDLQKVWLKHNVPAGFEPVGRSLVLECGLKFGNEFSACDEYVFKDADGNESSFFIYMGNWP
jgi:hypothetical protein